MGSLHAALGVRVLLLIFGHHVLFFHISYLRFTVTNKWEYLKKRLHEISCASTIITIVPVFHLHILYTLIHVNANIMIQACSLAKLGCNSRASLNTPLTVSQRHHASGQEDSELWLSRYSVCSSCRLVSAAILKVMILKSGWDAVAEAPPARGEASPTSLGRHQGIAPHFWPLCLELIGSEDLRVVAVLDI